VEEREMREGGEDIGGEGRMEERQRRERGYTGGKVRRIGWGKKRRREKGEGITG
jgi:hypothetical protein